MASRSRQCIIIITASSEQQHGRVVVGPWPIRLGSTAYMCGAHTIYTLCAWYRAHPHACLRAARGYTTTHICVVVYNIYSIPLLLYVLGCCPAVTLLMLTVPADDHAVMLSSESANRSISVTA